MTRKNFFIFAIVCFVGHAASARAGTCTRVGDCGEDGICASGTCRSAAELSPSESMLRVLLDQPVLGASLYIDDQLVGQIPWEGVIPVGPHAIRIEAPGMQPQVFDGQSPPQKLDTLFAALVAAPPAPASQGPAVTEGTAAPADGGLFYVGPVGGVSLGTAMWGKEGRPYTTLAGGLNPGFHIISDPIWLDLGLTVAFSTTRIAEWKPLWGQFLGLRLGIMPRLMFQVGPSWLSLAVELEGGYMISNNNYLFAMARFGLSFIPLDWLEIRLNPAGGEFLQELQMKGLMGGYLAQLAVVARF
ncbi:MAG: hypothetical protein PHU25_20605 [Deltaproteobacteria bacterium]|nr:hypothetical protein [Deltaproteobacteria bacterium]